MGGRRRLCTTVSYKPRFPAASPRLAGGREAARVSKGGEIGWSLVYKGPPNLGCRESHTAGIARLRAAQTDDGREFIVLALVRRPWPRLGYLTVDLVSSLDSTVLWRCPHQVAESPEHGPPGLFVGTDSFVFTWQEDVA